MTQEKQTRTTLDLDYLDQLIEQACISRGLKPPVQNSQVGQTSVRISVKLPDERENTQKPTSKK